jgi:hypothetical protein
MTEIDFAYFNYEHVLSAYLPCPFLVGPGWPAGRLVTGLPRVAATVAVHADDFVFVSRLGVVGCRTQAGGSGGDAGAGG